MVGEKGYYCPIKHSLRAKTQTHSWLPRGFQAREDNGYRPETSGQSQEGEARAGEVQRRHGYYLVGQGGIPGGGAAYIRP